MKLVLGLGLLALLLIPGCAQPGNSDAGAPVQPEVPVLPAVPAVDVQDFLADYKRLVTTYPDRANNGPEHIGARNAMAATFASYGLDVWLHNFTEGIDQQNVVGIQWGAQRDQWIVVGAHYDTFSIDCLVIEVTPAPCVGRKTTGGVYDDGSGTALTLYMAKIFSKINTTYTIVYAEFDGEERGLQGSLAFVTDVLAGTTPYGNVTIRAAIDVDMFGLNWPGVSTPVEFSHTSPGMQAAVEAARKELGVPDDMIVYGDAAAGGGSDFARFVDADIPTGFFSSNMGTQGAPMTPAGPTPTAPGFYPFWHIVDTWETMTASAGSAENLAAGFEVGAKLETAVLYAVAVEGVALQ